MRRFLGSWFLIILLAIRLSAQTPTPGPDTIIFINNEKLAGHFVSSTGSSVKFKSDVLGDITVDWSKIKELHTSSKVAVIRKGVRLDKHSDPSTVPQGTLSMEGQNLQVTSPPQAGQTIPLSDAATIVDQPGFEKALQPSGFFHGWGGAVTLGGTLVVATQDNRTFNGAINLLRVDPSESWIAPRNRTIFDFSASYGELSEPGTPTVKTSIYHADAERDEYLTSRIFAFGEAAFDHNYSQGLTLQQNYGGGVGWTAMEDGNQTLDLKASMDYVRQQFQIGPSQGLVGSTFAQHYHRKFKRGLIADEVLSFTPAWNNSNDYTASFTTQLTVPVYKYLSGSTGIIDSFLNNPPAGFKKNSFEYTLGLTYTLRH